MLFATLNNEKIEATPNTKATCPLCERPVFSKCGEVNVWHWAHLKDESCDSWYEPETEWHKNWKMVFGKDNSEIVIKKEGVRHIADILTNDSVIIELQNSPIQKPIVRRRENFYGDRMLWVINGKPFEHNFLISPSILHYKEQYYLERNYIQTQHGTVDKNTGEIISLPKKEFNFSWNWPRKSWSDVQRYVFIDFGDEFLFWVKDGMGTGYGRGVKVRKEQFIIKYGGDKDLLPTLIQSDKKLGL